MTENLNTLSFEITTRRSSKKTIDKINVRYGNEIVTFHGKSSIQLEHTIKTVAEEANIFECFNNYVDSVYDENKKLELFTLYKQLHNVVESEEEQDYKTDLYLAKPIVDSLLNSVDVNKYCRWIHHNQYLVIPPDLAVAASKGDYPDETTVKDDDYVHLVMLAFITRIIFPAVFSLQEKFTPKLGADVAELVCGELIKDNHVITNLPGWSKLNTYILFTFGRRGIPTQILDVVSEESFCDRVLFNTIFDRLCMAVIPETENNKNIATVINAAVRKHESKGVQLRAKDIRVNDDTDKRSLHEKYNISENTKFVNQVMQAEFFSFGLRDETDKERYQNRFKYQCKALGIKNERLVEKVYDNLPLNWEFFLYDHMLKLLQLTYVGVVSPFIFEACDYEQLLASIVLAQVKLSEEGYEYLPSLLGTVHDHNGMLMHTEGLRLNSTDREQLIEICAVQSRNSEGTSFNEAVEAAADFLEGYGNGKWLTNLEYGVLDNEDIYDRVKPHSLFPIDVEPKVKEEFLRLVFDRNKVE